MGEEKTGKQHSGEEKLDRVQTDDRSAEKELSDADLEQVSGGVAGNAKEQASKKST